MGGVATWNWPERATGELLGIKGGEVLDDYYCLCFAVVMKVILDEANVLL